MKEIAFNLRKVTPGLHKGFKKGCLEVDITMSDAMRLFMKAVGSSSGSVIKTLKKVANE